MINQKALINAIDVHSHQLEQLKGAVDKLKLQINGESSETNKYYAIVDKNMIFGNDENLNNISFMPISGHVFFNGGVLNNDNCKIVWDRVVLKKNGDFDLSFATENDLMNYRKLQNSKGIYVNGVVDNKLVTMNVFGMLYNMKDNSCTTVRNVVDENISEKLKTLELNDDVLNDDLNNLRKVTNDKLTLIANTIDCNTSSITELNNLFDELKTYCKEYVKNDNVKSSIIDLQNVDNDILSEIDSVKKNIEDVNIEIDDVKKKIENVSNECNYSNDIIGLRYDIETIIENNDLKSKRIDGIDVKINNLKDLQDDTSKSVVYCVSEITKLKNDEIVNLSNLCDVLSLNVDELNECHDKTDSKLIDLNGDVERINSKCTDIENNVSEICDKNIAMNNVISEVRDKCNDLETNVNKLREKIDENSNKYSQLNSSVSELHDEYVKINNSISELRNENDVKYTQIDNIIDNIQNTNTEFHNTLTNIQSKSNDLETNVANIRYKCTTIENNIIQIRKENNNKYTQLNSDISELRDESNNKFVNIQSKYTELNNNISQLNDNIDNIQNTNTEFHNTLTNIQSKCDDLESDISTQNSKIDQSVTSSQNAETNSIYTKAQIQGFIRKQNGEIINTPDEVLNKYTTIYTDDIIYSNFASNNLSNITYSGNNEESKLKIDFNYTDSVIRNSSINISNGKSNISISNNEINMSIPSGNFVFGDGSKTTVNGSSVSDANMKFDSDSSVLIKGDLKIGDSVAFVHYSSNETSNNIVMNGTNDKKLIISSNEGVDINVNGGLIIPESTFIKRENGEMISLKDILDKLANL